MEPDIATTNIDGLVKAAIENSVVYVYDAEEVLVFNKERQKQKEHKTELEQELNKKEYDLD
jgi:hypothetical protein